MEQRIETSGRGDHRRTTRFDYRRPITCIPGPGGPIAAQSQDVGRGGMSLRVKQALWPGQRVLIQMGGHEFKARVAWCHPCGKSLFAVGLSIYQDGPDVALAISEFIYDALDKAGATASLREERRPLPNWPLSPALEAAADVPSVVLARLSYGVAAGLSLGLVMILIHLSISAL